MALKYSATLRNAQLDAITTTIGTSGTIKIYTGTRPANVAAAITGTLLGTLALTATAAPGASGGVWTASTITGDSSADATGTATHFRVWKSDGTTAVMDGDVGTSGSDLNLTTTSIVSGQPINITSFTITAGNA